MAAHRAPMSDFSTRQRRVRLATESASHERTAMPTYLIAAQHRPDSPFNLLDDHQQVWRDLAELDEQMRAAGVIVFSRGLEAPDAAVTFRAEPTGAVTRTAGPYAPSTLAGMWIIDCPAADAE